MTQADYFWMRLDCQGNDYATYISSDITTDADAVQWTFAGSSYVGLGDSPWVGIGGWNCWPGPSGELAEFDYFRVGALIPEPTSIALLAGGIGLIGLRRRREG